MKKAFWIMIFVFFMVLLLGQCERNSRAKGAEWRNGVYYPTRPGDQMYSYYHGTPRGTIRRPPPRYYQPPHRHHYVHPPVYRPNIYGRHGSVDVGPIHIRW